MYNNSSSIVESYNNSNMANQNPKTKKTFIITIVVAVVIVLILTISLVILLNSNQGKDEPTGIKRENTPTLQLYAKLDKEVPAKDLESTVKSLSNEAEVVFDDDGTGYIEIPGQEDYILFDYYVDEDEENDTASTEEDDIIDIVSNIRYTYPIDDSGYFIGYVEDGDLYQVFNLEDTFDFNTKEKAIEAYLNQ